MNQEHKTEADQDEIALFTHPIARPKITLAECIYRVTEQDKKDAERYRWLCEQHDNHLTKWSVRDGDGEPIGINGLDTIIDAAMEKP